MLHIRSNKYSRGRRFFSRLFVLCCFIFFMAAEGVAERDLNITMPTSPTAVLPSLKIYFYNPEINASRNIVLKNTWDNYLDAHGQFVFQPVDAQNDFNELLQEEASAVFIMSEWLFDKLNPQQKTLYKVALQGLKDGADTYHRILVGQTGSVDLERARIASSGDKTRSLTILSGIYPELSAAQVAQLKILQVPKDIDALMALGYGLADLALSSEHSLSNLAKLNKSRFQQLNIIKKSKPLSQSIVVLKSISAEDKNKLIPGLLTMSDSETGRQAMSLIGLDNWKIIDPEISRISGWINREDKTMVADETNDQLMGLSKFSDSTKTVDAPKQIDDTNNKGGRD